MSLKPITILTLTLAVSMSWVQQTAAQQDAEAERMRQMLQNMNTPFAPFHLIGNVYYVGAKGLSSYLIVTEQGHILIDSGLAETVPWIRRNVATLGFRFDDIKLLLNSHAHIDHAGGHALVKMQTGAEIVMSDADAITLSRGGRGDFLPYPEESILYPPAKADRIVQDQDQVSLGETTLTAHLTPGHTKGCTTWTTSIEEQGKQVDVVFLGGTSLIRNTRLSNNTKYPNRVQDFESTFKKLKNLPCDVFLAQHPNLFSMEEKSRRLEAGDSPNPFVDPKGYRAYIDQTEQRFLRQLQSERPQ